MITLLARLALAALVALPAPAQAAFSPGPATPLSFRNRLINGNLAINQRAVGTASASYAAGAYTVDRWKAGGNGATMSLSAAANGDVTASITAGTLLQIIEGGLYLPEGGTYTASWSGTATCRAYQGSNAGSYVASPIVVTGWSAGTNGTIECQGGSLGLVQFEPGSVATAFERRNDEMDRAQRYFQKSYELASAPGSAPGNGAATITLGAPSGNCYATFKLSGRMRTGGTVTVYDGTGASGKISYYDSAWRGGGATSAVTAKESWIFIQTNVSGSIIVNFDFAVSAEL